ncbi:hypothetical protein BMI90_15910 [Thioclava sp. L04-15]|uniref:hypothetical protein n=1 Tax=Thioclava sp. L04-15 TaxID=1915318 RepID=UPI000995F5E5|nr:hypothetical protein [Thioclava sp. L04-15]OOY26901.1 hypothetical protein BMI90_15910 [Thioclava sp. L04-15]TNE86645.1 MAG: hypothetical protein EP337_11795 [Paracoccaceae bacterium]
MGSADTIGLISAFTSIVADIATFFGISVAIYQFFSWRRQQLLLRAQSVAEDLLAIKATFLKDLFTVSSPPELKADELDNALASDPHIRFLKYVRQRIDSLESLERQVVEFMIIFAKLNYLKQTKYEALLIRDVVQLVNSALIEAKILLSLEDAVRDLETASFPEEIETQCAVVRQRLLDLNPDIDGAIKKLNDHVSRTCRSTIGLNS